MTRLTKAVIATLSIAVFLYAGLGYVLGRASDDKAYRSLTVYGEVLQHIQEEYVDEPNMALVTAGALHGLLESLDPLSGYLSPREYSDYKERSKGPQSAEPGLTVSKRFGYIMVVSVLPDGPAAKAGLRGGDILEAIGGFATRDMSVSQAKMLLEGQPGTTVKVGQVRRGKTEPQEVSLGRVAFAQQKAVTGRVGEDVGYIRMPALDAGSAAELRNHLLQFDRQGVRKLILDLRGSARGPISEGVAAAQLFLKEGKITSLEGQTISREEFRAAPEKIAWKHPVEVLTSLTTAGPAEILAAAIGSNKRGDVVGERTFGTASEQKVIPIDGGGALVLTVAFYYTPEGKSILEEGVTPTAEVRPRAIDPAAADTSDEIPALLGPGQLPPSSDPIMNKALELLKVGEVRKAA